MFGQSSVHYGCGEKKMPPDNATSVMLRPKKQVLYYKKNQVLYYKAQ